VARSLNITRKILHEWRNAFRAERLARLSRNRGRKPSGRAKPPELMPDDPPDGGPLLRFFG
jgi:transposase-like protein